jgi:hypothetical protein
VGLLNDVTTTGSPKAVLAKKLSDGMLSLTQTTSCHKVQKQCSKTLFLFRNQRNINTIAKVP